MTAVTPIRDWKAYLDAVLVQRVIDAASSIRDKLLVRMLWRTGIRVTELINIRIPDIDFDNRAILIKVQKMRKKDGKAIERRKVVPIDWGTLDCASSAFMAQPDNGHFSYLNYPCQAPSISGCALL